MWLPQPHSFRSHWGPSGFSSFPIMLQAQVLAFSASCESSLFPQSTEHAGRRSPQTPGSDVTSIQCLHLELQRSLSAPGGGRKEKSCGHRKGRGGSRSRGCGGEQHTQLDSCWELFVKDKTSPLNWNPGMDSRECSGLLGQYSHSQVCKAGRHVG